MDNILLFFIIIFFINLFFLLVSISNILFLKQSSIYKEPFNFPKISVLIPARNEEKNIEKCLNSLLNLDYPNYEVIVLNDNSTDKTEEILKKYKNNPLFKYFNGKILPHNWNGKPFACQQLLEYSTGEFCFFSDADTIHSKKILKFLIGKIEEYNVDFISGFAFQKALTIGEKLIIPSLYIMTSLFLPLFLINKTKMPLLSFAIGQAIFVRKKALQEAGGFEIVKNEVVEDLVLARKMKEKGYKTLFIDLKDYIECRMYNGFLHGFNGISRVIFPAIGKSFLILVGLIFFIFSSIEIPIIYSVINYGNPLSYSKIATYSIILFSLAWGSTLLDRKLPFLSFVLYPLFFLNIIIMAINSSLKITFGNGIIWKERLVK